MTGGPRAYLATAGMNLRASMYFGFLYVLGEYALRGLSVFALVMLWRSVYAGAIGDPGFTLSQMLSYTVLSSALSQQLNVRMSASSWLRSESIVAQYVRPLPLMGGMMAEAVGGWAVPFVAFSVPLLALAALLGVSIAPATIWALPSLLLSISLGFAIDFLFACLMIRVPNATWLAHMIRGAVTSLLSGAVIPFAALPWGIGEALRWQPLASLASAPLSLAVGLAAPGPVIAAQVVWNALLWPAAWICWARSQERMVSFDG